MIGDLYLARSRLRIALANVRRGQTTIRPHGIGLS